jgi:spore photoproduct lyase
LPISQLFIDAAVAGQPLVGRIQRRLGIPARTVNDPGPVFEQVAAAPDPVQAAKEVLLLTRNRGPFIRKCPGTRCYTCCGYQILHVATFCVMDCSYCILQSYFHPPLLQFFLNHDEMLRELAQTFARPAISRIGTGEFTDSLIWEPWTGLSRDLVMRFAGQNRAVLELKTKTAAISDLLQLPHNKKTILAWSVNTPRVIAAEERRTASLKARLQAAATAAAQGYPVAFHFDPMVIYAGCEAEYQAVVAEIFAHVAGHQIVWISIGTFRFMPELKPILRQRFPESRILTGEFIPGLDGKLRYFKPLRIRLYQAVIRAIREAAPDVCVYFCMEDDEVWQQSLGFVPAACGGLPRMLDRSAVSHCELDADLLS